jgi:hypothetical protein
VRRSFFKATGRVTAVGAHGRIVAFRIGQKRPTNLSLVSLQHQRKLAMAKTAPAPKLSSKHRPPAFSAATWTDIQTVFQAAKMAKRRERRFSFYAYLRAVYSAYRKWKRVSISKKTARQIARTFRVPARDGVSPIRIIIEATLPEAGRKQHSRWVRALQFASLNDIPCQGLLDFFRSNGGVAGCASLAAERRKRRKRKRSSASPVAFHWAEF